ncbi:MAG: T9SS type A sorting domain-containing protein, partial [Bacteroidales bacterium]|nr:T9SS type A sorting domain-containing protein [Bacteroidales bacterium]
NNNLTISIDNLQCIINNVSVLDLTGKQIMSSLQTTLFSSLQGRNDRGNLINKTTYNNSTDNHARLRRSRYDEEINIDIKSLPAGIYFLKVETNRGTVVKKFVKQ